MSERKAIRCSSCGGSSPRDSDSCQYCGSYLLHLTAFELLKAGPSPSQQEGVTFFRSLRGLYKFAISVGVLGVLVLYVFMFDQFSETALVALSPLWFLSLAFGLGGLHGEKAVQLIHSKKATDFPDALALVTRSLPPFLVVLVYLVFALPAFFLGLKRWCSSPLLLATMTSGLWGLALYFFLFAIFPSL